MKILVCIKQVADSESVFTVAEDGLRLDFGARVTYRINSYDEYAIEEALLIAERIPGTRVEVLSIGPGRVKESIRRALSMGAAGGYHILYESQGNPGTGFKARAIAAFARPRRYDLILAGVMSEDFGNCAVGPMAAACLGIPWATHVIAERTDPASGTVYVEREIDGSIRHALTLKLPALLTVQSGINRPRYPSLTNVLRAKTQDIPTITLDDLLIEGDSAVSSRLFVPEDTRRGIFLQTDREETAERLWQYLHSKSLI